MSHECKECGTIHPPLAAGERCPMAKEESPTGDVLDFTSFFSQMKNILTSNIQSKNIKDTQKLFGQAVIILTKFLEDYKE